jgi:hypothetical protein
MPNPAALIVMLLAAAPASDPVGAYRLTGVHDAAAELVLHADGRFDYAMAEGALDQESSGRWTREGNRVLLTTEPKPVAPVFSPGAIGMAKDASLSLKVVWPNGRGVALVDFRILFTDGSSAEGYTQEDGWSLEPGDARVAKSIQLAVPMHDLVSPIFPLDPAKGNAFTFLLTPNDLGRVDFEQVPLDIAPGRLIFHREGQSLVYVRDGGDPSKR